MQHTLIYFAQCIKRYCVNVCVCVRGCVCGVCVCIILCNRYVTCTCTCTGTKELDDFLLVFLSCGSLFCSPDGVVPFLKEYIILDPPAFIQEMDTLYYIEFHAKSHPAGLDSEVSWLLQLFVRHSHNYIIYRHAQVVL